MFVGCGVCDATHSTRRSSGAGPRACVRVCAYARVLVPPNLYKHTHDNHTSHTDTRRFAGYSPVPVTGYLLYIRHITTQLWTHTSSIRMIDIWSTEAEALTSQFHHTYHVHAGKMAQQPQQQYYHKNSRFYSYSSCRLCRYQV